MCDPLIQAKVAISMTQNGSPYKNAIAERVNEISKTEFKMGDFKGSLAQLKFKLDKDIHSYNHLKPHDSIEKLTPVQAHQRTGVLNNNWKNYREIKWERKKQETETA